MSLTAKETGSARIDPVDEGVYTAVCVGLVDIGLQEKVYEGKKKEQEQIIVIWELIGETYETSAGFMPRTISKTYTNSLHERSALRKDLKAWRGREFTPEELAGFDLTKLLGAPCQLQIIHRETSNGTFANISAIMALPKGMPRPKPDSKIFMFDIDADDAESALESLPNWMQERIKKSPTWTGRSAGNIEPAAEADDDGDLPF